MLCWLWLCVTNLYTLQNIHSFDNNHNFNRLNNSFLSHVLVWNCFGVELDASLASIYPFILDCKELLINLVDVSVSLIKRNCKELLINLVNVSFSLIILILC
jgi:hypothetical protein